MLITGPLLDREDGAAATLEMHNFYPLQEGFFFPSLPLTNQPALQTPVPWLCRLLQPTADLLAGDIFVIETPGGGGYGKTGER